MGRILVLLSLLFSLNGFAATPGNAPILTIAASGQNTQALSIPLSSLSGTGVNGIFNIYCGGSGSATASRVWPCYKNGANYQVSNSKTAYCFNFTGSADTGSSLFQFMSATATFGNDTATGSVTGPVWQMGAAGGYVNVVGPTADVAAAIPGVYVFTQNTWPGIQIGSSLNYRISGQCYEQ